MEELRIEEKILRSLGISELDHVPWGSHILHFFKTQSDLIDVVIPFIVTGLKQNDFCIWSIPDSLTIEKAINLLKSYLPTIEEYITKGQMNIITDEEHYQNNDFDGSAIFSSIIESEKNALDNHYDGLRVTGSSLWLEKSLWNKFMDYEEEVDRTIRNHNIIALCSYPLDKCDNLSEIFEVAMHHQLILIRIEGKWQSFLTKPELIRKIKETEKKYIQKLESEVDYQTSEIKTLLKQKDEFISQLGHDLKNPLGPLISLVPVLQKKINDPECLKILDTIGRNVSYMQNIVNKTLKLAQLNSPNFLLSLKKINVINEIAKTITINKPLFDSKNITINFLHDKEIIIYADPFLFTEVMNNLLNNAAKYTNIGGEITIHIEKNEANTVISIKDNGIGISKECLPHLFDEYYKVDPSRHDFDSSGLGLSITKRIIERHGGSIWVESEGLGKGTIFSFSLPTKNKTINS